MTTITWGHDALTIELQAAPGSPLTIHRWGAGSPGGAEGPYPVTEVLTTTGGRARASQRLVDTAIGQSLRVSGHGSCQEGDLHRLTVQLEAPGIAVTWTLTSFAGVAAATAVTAVRNVADHPITVLGLTSLTCPVAAALPSSRITELELVDAGSDWLGEGRWRRTPLAGLLADLSLDAHGQDPRGTFAQVSKGSWSTGTALPVGALVHMNGPTLIWQVEHNGPWRWEVGDSLHGAYLATSGPQDLDHQAAIVLQPGDSHTSAPTTVAVGADFDAATAELTAHRRAAWRDHPDRATRPVVFNDYMNTLMGDPNTAALLPLVEAAAEVGAGYFCIDAGWYDETGDWWDSVGAWQPSDSRFPGGIGEVLDRIREVGMVPGLWLEPEVVGVRSPIVDALPPEAYFSRYGERLTEHRRHHLDLRHPAARAHLDSTVDRLVGDLGIGYLKLDYNIDPGPGTDRDASSAGAGLLGHARAQLAWIEAVLDRHPNLVLENCASGAMRADPATLARFPLQSTSDQQDPNRYPAIAVAAPLSMPPEQAANWAYPQPDMTDEEIAATLCTALLGRFYLSGHLDLMTVHQRRLVAEAVAAHRTISPDIAASVPIWPVGLPGWEDSWLALGLRPAGDPTGAVLLTVWRRDGADAEKDLILPGLRGLAVEVEPVFPTSLPAWPTIWDPERAVLSVKAGLGRGARTIRIRPTH